jgi:predicted anti-sigma-YlaC factor YlaD
LLEEDTATVTKLLAVLLITKGLKIVFCLFVGYEENQAQELAVDAARGRHARRQKSHMPVAVICVAIIADLVGSGALEDVVRAVRVAELALSLPISWCSKKRERVPFIQKVTPRAPTKTFNAEAG